MQTRRARIAAKPLPSAIQPIAQSQPQQTQEQIQEYSAVVTAPMYLLPGDVLTIHAINGLRVQYRGTSEAYAAMGNLPAITNLHQLLEALPHLIVTALQMQSQGQAQQQNVVIGVDYEKLSQVIVTAMQKATPNPTPGKSVQIIESTPYVQTPLQTPPQTPSTPANKANKRGVYKSPDTLVDTPEFRQCVNEGMSKAELMKRFGVSESTIARAKRRLQPSVDITKPMD